MTRNLRLATRGSPLALAQTRQVADQLTQVHPGLTCELVVVKTTGDHLQNAAPEAPPPGKGLFTKEIEEALHEGRADAAVHSLKDLPIQDAPGLVIAAVPKRETPADALILRPGLTFGTFPEGSEILTGSPRRRVQWHQLYPSVACRAVRGNIDTRLRKLRQGTAVGLILAAAGIKRLGLDLGDCSLHLMAFEEMVPAPGQGALALQCRADDPETYHVLAKLNDPITQACVAAERAFLAATGGGCLAPTGAVAFKETDQDELRLQVAWAADETSPIFRASVTGPVADPVALGQQAANRIQDGGFP